jgi:hypothetical protein
MERKSPPTSVIPYIKDHDRQRASSEEESQQRKNCQANRAETLPRPQNNGQPDARYKSGTDLPLAVFSS